MKFRKLLAVALLAFVCSSAMAQLNGNCPGCVANTAQFVNPSAFAVGLFPDSIVVRQNDSVNIDVTYLLPQQINTGIGIAPVATVTEVDILGINAGTPLPNGLSVTCDQNANGCKYYPQTYRYGCVKVCGITSQAATNGYVLAQVSVAGTGTAAGQTQTQQQYINFYYKILPDTSACHSVCFQNKINSGCDSATLGIYAGIDITCPNPILNPCTFDWAYGNGQTGTGLTVTPVTYSAPGAYPVTLTANTDQLVVTAASFTVPPDPTLFGIACVTGCSWYNNICNGSGINNSANDFDINITIGSSNYSTGGAGSGNLTGNFTGLNYPVNNQAVSLYVHDKCLLTNITTATTTFTITGPGVYNWTIGSDASGSITVSQVPLNSNTYTDTVFIYSLPDTPVITVSKDSICKGDSVALNIGSKYAGYNILWYQDSTFIAAAGTTDTLIYVKVTGNYSVKVTNPATRCSNSSAPVAVAVSGTIPFAANIFYQSGPPELFLNPFLGGSSALWYFDSTLVSGQNGQFLPSLGNGNYYAKVFPTGFPQCSITSAVYNLNINGIDELPSDIYNLAVYPNPNNGAFTVKLNVVTQGNVAIKLTDMLGRSVYENGLVNITGEVKDNINITGMAKGIYTLEVNTAKGRATKRVVIN